MISATVIVVLAALAGWLLGLTAHALRVGQWRDPGARVAWTATAGLATAALLLASLGLCLLTRGAGFLLVLPVGLMTGSLGAWRASQSFGSAKATSERPPGAP